MGITYNKITALQIMRSMRSSGVSAWPRTDLASPALPERHRWTRAKLNPMRFGGDGATSKIYVAVPSGDDRLGCSAAVSTVYQTGLPPASMISLPDGNAMSSPELLFVEMGTLMSPLVQVLLGMELCGTFSRNSLDPRRGDITYGIKPATTVENIKRFLDKAVGIWGLEQARRTIKIVRDNAWSPMEAIVAAMAMAPISELGYGMGGVTLNPRIDQDPTLVSTGARQSRVPDMLFDGSNVGINYDGRGHLDLESIAAVASQTARQDDRETDDLLANTLRTVRAKSIDDLRRDRELAAMSYVVLPATSEDLFGTGALDALMTEVMLTLEHFASADMKKQRLALQNDALRERRQRLLWSLLPWAEAMEFAREAAAIERRELGSATLLDEATVTL